MVRNSIVRRWDFGGRESDCRPPQRRKRRRAYIWDAIHGSRNLKQVLIDEYGLGPSVAGWDMKEAFAVSADGRTIVGGSGTFAGVRTLVDGNFVLYDVNPQGQQEAWIAFLGTPIPEPDTLILSALTLTSLVCRARFTSVRIHNA